MTKLKVTVFLLQLLDIIGKLCCISSSPAFLLLNDDWVRKLSVLPSHPNLHARCIVTGSRLLGTQLGKEYARKHIIR